jgi:hypothetical protein
MQPFAERGMIPASAGPGKAKGLQVPLSGVVDNLG